MDFKELCDLFGGSIFPEDLRPNLDHVRSYLTNLESSLASLSWDLQISFWLVKSIYCTFQGDITGAGQCLESTCEFLNETNIVRLSPRWIMRLAVYGFYIDSLSHTYNRFGFKLDSSGYGSYLRMLETAQKDVDNKLQLLSQQFGHQSTMCDHIERALTRLTTHFPSMQNTQACGLHPHWPLKGVLDTDEQRQSHIRSIQHLESMKTHLLTLNLPIVVSHVERMIIDLLFITDSPNATPRLQELSVLNNSNQDELEQALSLIREGDSLVSPPFTGPLYLNLFPIETTGANHTGGSWDSYEDSIALTYNASAQSCYAKASSLFESRNCTRGCAQVLLRRSCIAHGMSWTVETQQERDELLVQSISLNLQSYQLSASKDPDFLQIINTHNILTRISQQQTEGLVASAAAIGESTSSRQSFALGEKVGLLFMKYAARQWKKYSRAEAALLGCQCAHACLSHLVKYSPFPFFQSLVAQIEIHLDLSNHQKARVLTDAARKLVGPLLDVLRKDSAEYEKIRDTANMTAFGTLNDFLALGLRAYYYVWDEDAVSGLVTEILSYPEYNVDRFAAGVDNDRLQKFMTEHGNGEAAPSVTINQAAVSQVALADYYVASIKYQRSLENLDVMQAELDFNNFIPNLTGSAMAISMRRMIISNAYSQLGHFRAAQEALSQIPESEFFNDTVQTRDHVGSSWDGNKHSTSLWSRSGADASVSICAGAKHWELGARLLSKIESLSPSYLDLQGLDTEGDSWHRFCNSGLIFEHTGNPERSFKMLQHARYLIEHSRSQMGDESARRSIFYTSNSREIFHALARLSLMGIGTQVMDRMKQISMTGSSNLSNSERALQYIEQARTRSLLDELHNNRPENNIADDSKTLLGRYKRSLLTDLLSLPKNQRGVRSTEDEKEIEMLETELAEDTSYCMPSSSIWAAQVAPTNLSTDIRKAFDAIPPGTVVIELAFSSFGMLSFCITQEGIQKVHKSDMTVIEARRAVANYLKPLKDQSEGKKAARTEVLNAVIHGLSTELMEPHAEIISRIQHVIFIPSHPMISFPCSALLFQGKPLFLSKTISQVPSLAILHYLSTRKSLISKTPTIKAVAKPGSTNEAGDETPLFMAGIEALMISNLFNTTAIDANTLLRDDFSNLLQTCDILHLGTHGVLDSRSPWQNYVSLKERFRVIDLLKTRSQASIVIFGACLSGLGRSTAGSDLTGFSHLILQSGASVFIGALWRVSDVATMILMICFFRNIAAATTTATTTTTSPMKTQSIAELWTKAQREVYNMSTEDAKSFLKELLNVWDHLEATGVQPDKFVRSGRLALEDEIDELDDTTIDFRHPYNWAAFGVVGFGGLCIGS